MEQWIMMEKSVYERKRNQWIWEHCTFKKFLLLLSCNFRWQRCIHFLSEGKELNRRKKK